nr:immunoglobulin light chain junction region [Macaca mulatta]
CMEYIYIPPTF